MEIKKRNLLLFITGIVLIGVLSLWGITSLQKPMQRFFLWQINNNKPIASASFKLPDFINPARNWKKKHLKTNSKAAITAEVNSEEVNSEKDFKILFAKNPNEALPIASLTKLMTSHIALKNYSLDKKIKINQEAVEQDEKRGQLKEGEVITVKDLLYISLVESSNDAAFALTSPLGEEKFVDLMNSEARKLELSGTYFSNPTGLDPDNYSTSTPSLNYSTVKDLAMLSSYLLKNQPKVWDILSTQNYTAKKANGHIHHKLEPTNELLKERPEIIGGKTGWTPMAGGCLLIVKKSPSKNKYLINIILGSGNRFEEMKKIIKWIDEAYVWR